MAQLVYNGVKTSIANVSNSKDLFVKELVKASKVLLPYEKDKLINWLFFYTADKPEMQQWLYEVLDKDILVS